MTKEIIQKLKYSLQKRRKNFFKKFDKRLIAKFWKDTFSPKSYNNHFGVPLTLSNLENNHKYGVFEVGMSKPGEIDALTKLIKPHIGIITNIGEAHIENFKNTRGIADAKGEMIKNIKKEGTIILNHDDNYFNYFKAKAKLQNLKVVTFGMSSKSDVYPIKLFKKKYKNKAKIKVKNQIYNLEIGDINIYNVLSSLALLKELNLDLRKIIKYFKDYKPTEGRGKIHVIKRYNKKFKLIDESYNANPLSVKVAIKNFNSIKKRNLKILTTWRYA